MEIRKQGDGKTRITLSDSELIDALEEKFRNVYENITETASVKEITNRYGNIIIAIGD